MQDFFSQTQGPENLHDRTYPSQRSRFIKNLMTANQPVSHAGDGLVEKEMRWRGAVQTARPAAHSGGIGQTIRVHDLRQCILPRAALSNATLQSLAACQQTVVRVRKRKQRKKSEGLPAACAAAATDPNPIVMLVVGLLAATSVTDNRILFTNRASA